MAQTSMGKYGIDDKKVCQSMEKVWDQYRPLAKMAPPAGEVVVPHSFFITIPVRAAWGTPPRGKYRHDPGVCNLGTSIAEQHR